MRCEREALEEQAGNHFPSGILSVLREHGVEPRLLMLTEYREHATQISANREVLGSLNLILRLSFTTGYRLLATLKTGCYLLIANNDGHTNA